jgi:hypothetical protein
MHSVAELICAGLSGGFLGFAIGIVFTANKFVAAEEEED